MVLPVHDANPTRRFPLVTYLLICINVMAFVLSPVVTHVVGSSEVAQQCRQIAFFDEYAAKPHELVTNHQDPPTDTKEICPSPAYKKVPFLSALTAMFLHASWLHLLGNMLFLYVFGNNVEDRLGRLRYLAFYLGCGYVATYGFALFQPSSTRFLVGASGAIAGVLGAYLVLFPRAKVLSLLTFLFFLPVRLPAWLVLGSWFLLQYVSLRAGLAEGAGVAYVAHVVGFIVGAAVMWSLRGTAQPRPLQPKWGPYARR